MIEISHLHKIYQIKSQQFPALNDINLNVKRGEIFGIIGKSGAGKSTLLRCVNFLERPTSGSVHVNQQNLNELSAEQLRQTRRQIGMIFQHFNLLNSRTVYANIALPLELAGASRATIHKTIMPLLEITGLEEKRDAFPNQLSGGQKQRVAIARALATQPSILLCDEITSALDPQTTQTILQLIKAIHQQLQLSILLITHEINVIKTIADRVAVMEHGKIIEEADTFTLFTQPKTATTRSFVESGFDIHLPPFLQQQLLPQHTPNSWAIWRFTFAGPSAAQSIIYHWINALRIEINILQANLEFIHNQPLGTMIIAIKGDPNLLNPAKEYLLNLRIAVEEMGYVTTIDAAIT